MAARPLIGITCSVGRAANTAPRVQLNEVYEQAVREAGGLPLLLAPGLDTEAMGQVLGVLQGLLLPGGVDVDPARYGAERHPTTQVSDELDALELPLAAQAVERGLPMLAICRGIQVLNVARGGSLWQDLP